MSKRKTIGIIAGCIIYVIIRLAIAAAPGPAPTYTILVTVLPSAGGSVSPSGGQYTSGEQVTLTANPASGYIFGYWAGSASGNASTVNITMDSNKIIAAKFLIAPMVTVNYEVKALNGTGYLSVRVEGPQKSYEIGLVDPEGEPVGYDLISPDDMLSGCKTVEISMSILGLWNPIPGRYWLVVWDSSTHEKVFEAGPVFLGPDTSITSIDFETHYDDYSGEGDIGKVIARVRNSGDLPVLADEMRVLVAGRQENITLYEALPHGELTVIEGLVSISGLGKETHPVTVEIYSEGAKLASYSTNVTIG